MIDKTLLRKLLRDLVAIDSVNPSLVPGARGESAAAQFLHAFLREHGIAAELQEALPRRSNVVVLLGGSDNAANACNCALAILAHVDTVGAGDMPDPFKPIERDGRLFGRGALDIKSGVAAMCAAAIALVREGARFSRPLLLSAVVDEECNSAGTEALLKEYSAGAAVVLEPTDLELVVAHKGYAWYEITTHGRSAHGSLPNEGRDAIRMMGRVLAGLDELERSLSAGPAHALLGHGSLHASLISGGQELSSYPAECKLQMERRTLPGESEAQVDAGIGDLLNSIRFADPRATAGWRKLGWRPPFEIATDSAIALAAASAIRQITGSVKLSGMAGWTDTALLAAAGIPGVVFGPRGRGLHGAEEYVELDSVTLCAEVLCNIIRHFCCA